MRIARKYVGAGFATIIIAGIAVQSFGTAQAERMGYIQADCPTIVQNAVDAVGTACIKAGRNKLCYGNNSIHADFQASAGNPTFQAPGDVVDVTQVKQLTLGAMDTSANTWGVAEMRIKADLPNTDPNQNVTMILFGDVQLSDAMPDANATVIAQTPTALPADATQTAIAGAPQATKAAATATRLSGLVSTATAKASTPTATGTISAARRTQVAATATKFTALIATATPTATPDAGFIPGYLTLSLNQPTYQSMQACYFQASDKPGCAQAPHDGILIQTPQGGARVTLSINGVGINLGSTVFVQAEASKFLTVNTLEGQAFVFVQDTNNMQLATAGQYVQVPLDASLHPTGPPTTPQFYAADTVRALPLRILPTAITAGPGLPVGVQLTRWVATFGTQTASIPNCSDTFRTQTLLLGIDNPTSAVWIDYGPSVGKVELIKQGDRVYAGTLVDYGVNTGLNIVELHRTTYTLTVTSIVHMEGQMVEDLGTCLVTVPIAIDDTRPIPTALTPITLALAPPPGSAATVWTLNIFVAGGGGTGLCGTWVQGATSMAVNIIRDDAGGHLWINNFVVLTKAADGSYQGAGQYTGNDIFGPVLEYEPFTVSLKFTDETYIEGQFTFNYKASTGDLCTWQIPFTLMIGNTLSGTPTVSASPSSTANSGL